MANGNRNELMGGLRRTSKSSLECDVGLGLKMQPTESFYPCKRTLVMLPPHHHQNQHRTSEGTVFNGDDENSSGGGTFLCNTSYQVACLSDIYDTAGAGLGASAASVSAGSVLPRTWHPFTSPPDISTSFKSSGGGMPVSGKILFTASQRQELERQTMICKYIMASVPVPPELLLPSSKNQCPAPGLVSQPSSSTLSGSDPEPWRCRRTDGKKWRCSRNAAPDQKYCERHAHKSRPRSRKPVEIQSHNADATNNYTQTPLGLATNISSYPSRKQNAQYPTMGSAASYDQTRAIEWFTKGGEGIIPVSTSNQQWQHLMHSSSRVDLYQHSSVHNKESSFQSDYGDKQDLLTLLDNVGGRRLENQQLNGQFCNSILNPKMASLQGNLNTHTTQTRHFIDAWSAAETEGVSKICKKGPVSSGMKVPFSSLTLSMPGENEIDEDDGSADTCMGMMMGLERNSEEVMKSQWLNPGRWMGTTPGGPLGEALCLGVATGAKGSSNLPSPHGYSNSTTTSSCSRSSCEDGSQALNFIGGNQ